jgi:hypothetical protein
MNTKAPFDPKVTHHRDAKSGRVVSTSLHRKIVTKGDTGTTEYYEYPRKSGMFYHPNLTLDRERSAAGLKALEAKIEEERLAALEAAKTPEQREADKLKAAIELVAKSGALDEVKKQVREELKAEAKREADAKFEADKKKADAALNAGDKVAPVQPNAGAK